MISLDPFPATLRKGKSGRKCTSKRNPLARILLAESESPLYITDSMKREADDSVSDCV